MTVGDRIKSRRIQLHLSADDVAKAIGKDRSTIYRYESKEIEDLPVSIIAPLAKALQISPAYIMGWEENPTDILLTKHEKKVVVAYRGKPEMQSAVDKLLGVDDDEDVLVLRAARSDTNKPVEYIAISKEKMEQLKNASSVEDEVDL